MPKFGRQAIDFLSLRIPLQLSISIPPSSGQLLILFYPQPVVRFRSVGSYSILSSLKMNMSQGGLTHRTPRQSVCRDKQGYQLFKALLCSVGSYSILAPQLNMNPCLKAKVDYMNPCLKAHEPQPAPTASCAVPTKEINSESQKIDSVLFMRRNATANGIRYIEEM